MAAPEAQVAVVMNKVAPALAGPVAVAGTTAAVAPVLARAAVTENGSG